MRPFVQSILARNKALSPKLLSHDVLDHFTGKAAEFASDFVSGGLVKRRRLKTERLEVHEYAAALARFCFYELDDSARDTTPAIRRRHPKLLNLAALAPRASARSANYLAGRHARNTRQRTDSGQIRCRLVGCFEAIRDDREIALRGRVAYVPKYLRYAVHVSLCTVAVCC
jgi:hypothetical protein